MYTIELDFCGEASAPMSDEEMVAEWVREYASLGDREALTWTITGYANGSPVVKFTSPVLRDVEDAVKAYAPLTDDGIDGYDQAYLLTLICDVA